MRCMPRPSKPSSARKGTGGPKSCFSHSRTACAAPLTPPMRTAAAKRLANTTVGVESFTSVEKSRGKGVQVSACFVAWRCAAKAAYLPEEWAWDEAPRGHTLRCWAGPGSPS